jgi:hypothetical protein
MRISWALILFCACAPSPRVIDCTEENEVLRAITYASQQFTAPSNRIESLTVICRQEDPAPKSQCLIQYAGGKNWPYQGARIDVRDDIAPECVLHESMHLELYNSDIENYDDRYESYCTSHKKDCGWDEARLGLLTERFLNATD